MNTPGHPQAVSAPPTAELERLLRLLAAAAFLVFFQAFMVAPLIPRLADLFEASTNIVGLAVPAYLLPYGLMQLVWGPLSDRVGRGRPILGSLVAFILLTGATAAVGGAGGFVAIRLVTAVGASAVVPISLALVGDLFDYTRRGHALGWLFGAMAGGMAFGSTAGALLEPVIGWRGLFLGVSALAIVVLALLARRRPLLEGHPSRQRRTIAQIARGYLQLLRDRRAARTYAYVLFNAVLHSGIYTWLGLYFTRRYGLSETGIGLALLAYGVPGFLFGPVIGRLADRYGRAHLIPLGLAAGAVAAFLLVPHLPVLLPAITVGVLSLGYDFTQPLLAGIVTQLSENRGQARGSTSSRCSSASASAASSSKRCCWSASLPPSSPSAPPPPSPRHWQSDSSPPRPSGRVEGRLPPGGDARAIGHPRGLCIIGGRCCRAWLTVITRRGDSGRRARQARPPYPSLWAADQGGWRALSSPYGN